MIREVMSGKVNDLTLLGETEWQPLPDRQLAAAFKERGVRLTATHCGMEYDYYKNIYEKAGVNAFVELWPTYWLHHTEQCLNNEGWNHIDYNIVSKFESDFICLNNRGHVHRCRLIDELSKENLINRGVVTWVDCLNEGVRYEFKHFDNRKITLKDDFSNLLSSFILPKEFHSSFFHLVTECNEETFVLSEKTAKVLLFKKFFVVQGSRFFHQRLKDLGFMLFDEIIDYSFDSEQNPEIRTKKLVEALKSIITVKDKTAVFESIKHKIEHNYQRCLKILNDPMYVPKIYRDIVDNPDRYPTVESDFYGKMINRNKA